MSEKEMRFEKTVVSTRIRLARNLAGYPFPSSMTEKQADEVAIIAKSALEHSLSRGSWKQFDMRTLSRSQAMLLQEQHLVSPALVDAGKGLAFVDGDENISVMVNEEDHLRLQYIVKGLKLEKAYERISLLDDKMGRFMNYAYEDRLGFLTACPSNVGTGMRASVMMFLPALERKNAIGELVKKWSECGLTVRGVFGEGTAAEGYRYQISNDKTLGLTEEEILEYMHSAITEIALAEEEERKKMTARDGLRLRDAALRSYGVLTNCARLEYKEMRDMLTQVKLGVALGVFEISKSDPYVLDAFIDQVRPYSFCDEFELFDASQQDRDIRRAEIVGTILPTLVQKAD